MPQNLKLNYICFCDYSMTSDYCKPNIVKSHNYCSLIEKLLSNKRAISSDLKNHMKNHFIIFSREGVNLPFFICFILTSSSLGDLKAYHFLSYHRNVRNAYGSKS